MLSLSLGCKLCRFVPHVMPSCCFLPCRLADKHTVGQFAEVLCKVRQGQPATAALPGSYLHRWSGKDASLTGVDIPAGPACLGVSYTKSKRWLHQCPTLSWPASQLGSGPTHTCNHPSALPCLACLPVRLQCLFNEHCAVVPGTPQSRQLKVAHVNELLDRLSAAAGEGRAAARASMLALQPAGAPWTRPRARSRGAAPAQGLRGAWPSDPAMQGTLRVKL